MAFVVSGELFRRYLAVSRSGYLAVSDWWVRCLVESLLKEGGQPETLFERARSVDMRALLDGHWRAFRQSVLASSEQRRKILLTRAVAPFSERLRLNPAEDAVSIDVTRVCDAPCHLYSSSGHSIWFAPEGFDYTLQLFERAGDHLRLEDIVRVTKQSPLLVEGDRTVVEVCAGPGSAHLAFSLNQPVPGSDIQVYDRKSLVSIAWFPADAETPRYLMLLEALGAVGDPALQAIAEELIYHPHSAVRWRAFKVLSQACPDKTAQYRELLLLSADAGLQHLCSSMLEEGA